MRKKTGNIYVTIKLPEGITKMIDEQVKKREFTSRTDYLKYVVRSDIDFQRQLYEKQRYEAELENEEKTKTSQ